ncbi:leucine-rich repeat protein, partial [bacterium]|nr:leucine-rich repeat protein [bacterium]
AFSSCFNLQTVNFSEDISSISIEEGAFNQCEALTAFTLPDNTSSIGANALCNCTNLASVTWKDTVYNDKYAFNSAVKTAGIAAGDVWI